MTKVIYHADEFGRVKTEQYTQTRLADGQITLDYSEHYETQPTHRGVRDGRREVSAAESRHPDIRVMSDEEDDGDSRTIANQEEEVLTEEEKKGSVVTCRLANCFSPYRCA